MTEQYHLPFVPDGDSDDDDDHEPHYTESFRGYNKRKLLLVQHRKIPITSYGILLYTFDKEGNPLFLISQRRDTIAYKDFIQGNYNYHNLDSIVSLISLIERERLLTYSFDEIWIDMWIDSTCRMCRQEYRRSKKIYNSIQSQIPYMIHKTHSEVLEPQWGFPKGKKRVHESDVNCALREFEEETGMDASNLQIKNMPPFIEIFQGSNKKIYKTVYFLAECKEQLPILYRELSGRIRRFTISEEIGDLKWCYLKDAKDKVNIIRQNILNEAYIKIKQLISS